MNLTRPVRGTAYTVAWCGLLLLWQFPCLAEYRLWVHRYREYAGACGVGLDCSDTFNYGWFHAGSSFLVAAVLLAGVAVFWTALYPYRHLVSRIFGYIMLVELWVSVVLGYLSALPVITDPTDPEPVIVAYWQQARFWPYVVCFLIAGTALVTWAGYRLVLLMRQWRTELAQRRAAQVNPPGPPAGPPGPVAGPPGPMSPGGYLGLSGNP